MIGIGTLLRDPIFQINLLLWSLMGAPHDPEFNIKLTPVLRNWGYTLYAIEKSVNPPRDFEFVDAISPLISNLDSPIPDLWLKHEEDAVEPILELKSRGFSPSSDKSIQMIKIMTASADLSETLGGGNYRPGHVIMTTIAEDTEEMISTFGDIGQENTGLAGAVAAHTGRV